MKQGSGFRIDIVVKEDVEDLFDLALNASREDVFPGLSSKGIESLTRSHKNEVYEIVCNPSYLAYKAVVNNIIAGFITCRDKNHITQLYVLPRFQGQGIATGLLSKLLELKGGNEMTVRSSLNAAEFYQNRGFIKSGEETEFNGIRYIPMKYCM